MELKLICSNCRGPFVYKAETSLEIEAAKALSHSWCCDACCKYADSYFESDEYKAFIESEQS